MTSSTDSVIENVREMITTQCHDCRKTQEVPDHYQGELTKCAFCGKRFIALLAEDTPHFLSEHARVNAIARRTQLLEEIRNRSAEGYLAMDQELRSHIEAEHSRLRSLPLESWSAMERDLYREILGIPERREWINDVDHEELRSELAELRRRVKELGEDMDLVVPRTGPLGGWASPRVREDS